MKTLFIKLPKSWVPRAGASVERLLLDATVESYRYSFDETFAHTVTPEAARRRLIGSLQHAGRFDSSQEAAFAVLEDLLQSPSVEESDIGLIAGVRMSYDPALADLEANLDSIRLRQRTIGSILFEMETQYNPSSPEGMARVKSLILLNRRVQVPGLDIALAKSLRRIGSDEGNSDARESLPLAALLLESSDPEAVRRAAHQFYVHAMVSSEDGYGGKSISHEGIKSHNGLSKKLSAQEQAEFWRNWWADTQ